MSVQSHELSEAGADAVDLARSVGKLAIHMTVPRVAAWTGRCSSRNVSRAETIRTSEFAAMESCG